MSSPPPSFVSSFADTLLTLRPESPATELPHSDLHGPESSILESATDDLPLPLLATTATPTAFHLGTGASLLTQALVPAILEAQHEVLFVTCFWARSASLDALGEGLARLARRRVAQRTVLPLVVDRDSPAGSGSSRRGTWGDARNNNRHGNGNGEGNWNGNGILRVRIGLSSLSLLQNFLHTSSPSGYIYPPATWQARLGLPDPALLRAAGIDLQVKSVFFAPFSVLHPKFVVVDREKALLPSCNVSWEAWLECCVQVKGEVVEGLVEFWGRTWASEEGWREWDGEGSWGVGERPRSGCIQPGTTEEDTHRGLTIVKSSADLTIPFPPSPPSLALPTFLLPSAHHRNPHFRLLPWQPAAPAPATPLNTCLLALFAHARREIFVQTPNVTSAPVVAALLEALARGVDVRIVTGRNMMLWEQLLTAGTTTGWCLWGMVRRYERLRRGRGREREDGGGAFQDHPDGDGDVEAQRPKTGMLRIEYFRSKADSQAGGRKKKTKTRRQTKRDRQDQTNKMEEPVHSHVKLTIADGRLTVLGSGNMDRASWFTSQELGILFEDAGFAGEVGRAVERVLEGRLEGVYDAAREGWVGRL